MKLLLLFFILTISFYSSAKFNERIKDSLESIVNAKGSKLDSKIDALNNLCLQYGEFDFIKADYYIKKLYILSVKNKNQIGLGHFYMNRTNRCMIKGDFKKAEKNALKARSFYLRNKDNINNIILSNYALCFAFDFQNRIKKAEKNALKCIKLYKNKPNNEKIAELYFYLATIYGDEKDIKKSFNYLNQAIKVFEREKSENGLFKCKYQMASICFTHQMYQKSLSYLNELTTKYNRFILSKIEFKLRTEEFYANIFIATKNYNNALKHAKLYEKIVSKFSLIQNRNNANLFFCEIYLGLKKYDLVNDCISKLDLANLSENELFRSNKIKGMYYYAKKKYQKSLFYTMLNYKTNPNGSESLKFLAQTSLALKDYKSAYFFYEKYAEKEINQLRDDKESELKSYEIKYKIKDKDYQIKTNQLELYKNEIALHKQSKYIGNFILITSLLFVFILFLVYNYYSKKKTAELLQNKNEELFSNNQLLNKIVKEKELLLKEVHHRVKNNLQLVLSLLNIQAEDSNNSIEVFIEKSRARISTMSIIHQNLYLSNDLSCIHFQNYLEELIEFIIQTFDYNNIEIEIDSNEIDFDLDLSITLGLIVNELVCNSMKYAFTKMDSGKIKIALSRVEDRIFELIISDNGIGFNKNELKTSNSVGTDIVELLVLQLKGTIEHINQNGTCYKITFESNC